MCIQWKIIYCEKLFFRCHFLWESNVQESGFCLRLFYIGNVLNSFPFFLCLLLQKKGYLLFVTSTVRKYYKLMLALETKKKSLHLSWAMIHSLSCNFCSENKEKVAQSVRHLLIRLMLSILLPNSHCQKHRFIIWLTTVQSYYVVRRKHV